MKKEKKVIRQNGGAGKAREGRRDTAGLTGMNRARKGVKRMGRIKADEVMAYQIGNDLVCSDCASDEETKDLEEDAYLTDDDFQDEHAFCDRCKKKIN